MHIYTVHNELNIVTSGIKCSLDTWDNPKDKRCPKKGSWIMPLVCSEYIHAFGYYFILRKQRYG